MPPLSGNHLETRGSSPHPRNTESKECLCHLEARIQFLSLGQLFSAQSLGSVPVPSSSSHPEALCSMCPFKSQGSPKQFRFPGRMLTLQSKVQAFHIKFILLTATTKNLKILVLKSSDPIAQLNYMSQEKNLLPPNIRPGALTHSRSLKMHLLAEKSKLCISFPVRKSEGHMGKKISVCVTMWKPRAFHTRHVLLLITQT